MNEIERYLADLAPEKRSLIERLYARVPPLVPDAVVARKYAMPCYAYRGKGLISLMATKAGISAIPYSGAVNRRLPGEHDLSAGSGSLHFTVEAPITDELFDELVRLRKLEIDG